MSPILILQPVVALALWTSLVAFWLAYLRFAGLRQGTIKPSYFKLLEGPHPPPAPALAAARNFSNLFEVPVLFYVVAILFYLTGPVTGLSLGLAWLFFVSRVIHSLIHLGPNKITPRFVAFALGVLAQIGLFIYWAGSNF
jgi:hypothetical protein